MPKEKRQVRNDPLPAVESTLPLIDEWDRIIVDDLIEGILPESHGQLTPRKAWDDVYSHMVEFQGVEYRVFRERLKTRREEHKNGLPTVDWLKSAARQVILDDLKADIIPLNEATMSAQDCWDEIYSNLVEFHGVPYQQFWLNFTKMRDAHAIKKELAVWDEMAVDHDIEKFKVKTHNTKGQRCFWLSEALPLLLEDVRNKKHLRMKPKKLWQSRTEYREFSLEVFRPRIYQAECRIKFENYLEDDREKKETLKKINRASRNPVRVPVRRKK